MPDREVLEVDVLIVGGGPAGLSAAWRLADRQRREGKPISVAVIEKAREAGAHALSGAVLDPSALRELMPDFAERGAPLSCPVRSDALFALTERRAYRVPMTPPPLSNHGCFVISMNTFIKWFAAQVEQAGVDLFTGFGASEVLKEADRVLGVRTSDRGRDKSGQPTTGFQPGADIHAKVTIFCDGVRGNLTKTLVKDFELDRGRQPQVYALGIKELWELPPGRLVPGTVIHTLGYPLSLADFGGGFVYAMEGGLLSVGFVSGLDYRDPMFDPFLMFQRFKQHPKIAALLDGATVVRYGAKALPEGGWHTIPKLSVAGGLIAGDAGGFVNSMRLKGIHLAMRTAMIAADTAFDAVAADDVSAARLGGYDAAVAASEVKRELYPVRNVHQAFERGLVTGVAYSALALATGGWSWTDPLPMQAGHERPRKVADYYGAERPSPDAPVHPVTIDRKLTFDRVTSVFRSGTRHREDAPSHLIVHDTNICHTRCREEYGNPCTRFCPANVYEMVDDGRGGRRLQVNASNCIHCKTCDIMDPYQIIDWVPPEGGDGPQFDGL